MNRITLLLALLLMATASVAGRELDLRDITRGEFRGETLGAVEPLPDGESYARLSADGRRIVKYSFKTGQETGVLFDVTTARGAQLDAIDGYTVSPDGQRLLIQTATRRLYRHSLTATYYIYSLRNNRLSPLSDGGPQQAPLFSPDGQQIAFVRDNNIHLVKLLYDNAEVQVTRDGKPGEVINGIPDWVNEEEFAVSRSMVFTADSRQLVWLRYDESRVSLHAMPQYTYKYPLAGEDNATVTLWSFDIGSRQTRRLQLPLDADGYVPRLIMTADATQVAAVTLNRRQDCLRLFLCNPLSTVCRQVIEERASHYVRPLTVSGITLTSGHILLPSDRTGYMHLYLYNMHGQLLRQIDNGDYDISAVYGYDEATGNTCYASHENGATDQRLWVARADGSRQCLSQAGWNTAVFSRNMQYYLNTWSNLDTPPVTTLRTVSGKTLATLTDNDALRRKLAAYTLGSRELFTLTTPDGTTLNGWMVKPADFDPSRRYPVIMYQYGGPGSQQVRDAWDIGITRQGAILEQLLCQQGYLCVCVDNRGTGGRGVEFETCTYQRLGQLEARDQADAAQWLAAQPYVDARRIAIWGWSYGGFNTLMAMSEGRPLFRAGIAIAPPTSWRYYDTIYTERYMRTPQQNPTGYDDSPLSRAPKLHGALLLCHGMADDNVHFRNTAEYTDALVQADKDYQQLVYPNSNHSIYGGNTRNHLFRQCIAFFNRELTKDK